jgi:mitochondrial-processing peptidase subunit alpha
MLLHYLLLASSPQSTRSRTTEDLQDLLVVLGAQAFAGIGREALSYSTQVIRDYVPEAVELLSDTIQNSLFLPEELEMHKQVILYEHEEMAAHKHAMIGILHERAHKVRWFT